jgi:hypothetical protein
MMEFKPPKPCEHQTIKYNIENKDATCIDCGMKFKNITDYIEGSMLVNGKPIDILYRRI